MARAREDMLVLVDAKVLRLIMVVVLPVLYSMRFVTDHAFMLIMTTREVVNLAPLSDSQCVLCTALCRTTKYGMN